MDMRPTAQLLTAVYDDTCSTGIEPTRSSGWPEPGFYKGEREERTFETCVWLRESVTSGNSHEWHFQPKTREVVSGVRLANCMTHGVPPTNRSNARRTRWVFFLLLPRYGSTYKSVPVFLKDPLVFF
jgi:hypothetical protein